MNQVKDLIKNFPEFLKDYKVIRAYEYVSKFGDTYTILEVKSQYQNYTDIICDLENNYLSLGGGKSEYHKTIETVERLSLLLDCDRTLKSVSTYLVA